METYTIQELSGKVGEVISRIEAKIINVYERKTGEGQYGPWSLQGAEIEDSSGRFRVVFSKMADASNYNGRLMIFRASQGKNGLTGLMVKKSEYKGKEKIELWITPSSVIAPKGEDVENVQDSPRAPVASKQAVIEPSQVNHEDRKLGLAISKNRLTQVAGLYDLCWKAAKGTEYYKDLCGIDMKESERQDLLMRLAISMSIATEREGLVDKMPVRTTSKFYNEEALKVNDTKNPGSPVDDEPEDVETPF